MRVEIKNKTALAVSFSVHKNTSSAVIVLLHSEQRSESKQGLLPPGDLSCATSPNVEPSLFVIT